MRRAFNLDKDWLFHFGDIDSKQSSHSDSYSLAKAGGASGPAAKSGFDASDWRSVDLPHDYLVETEFAPENLLSHGYKTRGNAWYRKTFCVDETLRGQSMTLVFEGLSVSAVVYLNGSIVGRSHSAYSELEIDVTDRMYFGGRVNTLAVYIDGLTTEGWWYEGAGIYRHVMLYAKAPAHIANNGLWVKPVLCGGTDNDWSVELETTVENSAYEPSDCTIGAKIYDGGTLIAESVSAAFTCPADGKTAITQTLNVNDPERWDIDSPKLYRMEVRLYGADGAELDADSTRFGFRTIAADPDRGFILNGRPVKLKGTCNHQDHAGVGVAVPDSVQYYRVRRLREMGTNAYRCSHNMPTKAVLDACDELGLIVMDENRRFECSPEVLGHVETMVRRDRNHPCVAFYSLFNEEPLQSSEEGRRIYRRMKSLVLKLDDTRLLTGAINDTLRPEGTGLEMDITGINYSIGRIPEIHKLFPNQPIIGSENNSAVTTRGCYKSDREIAHVLNNYDEEVVPWGQSIRETWDFIRQHDYVAGIFIWTGFDYRGEPTPFDWPSCSSQFGIMDTCGFPKDSFYLNRACFVDEPMLHLFPHWNWKSGDTVRVMTASNCDEVELFVNGKSLGRKACDVCAPSEWSVPFEAGEIRADGYRGGKLVCSDKQETTGDPCKVVIEPDREYILDSGMDVVPIKVYVVDECGRAVPTANNHIRFTVNGDGFVLGVGNGDPNSHESDKLPCRDLYCGLCQALIEASVGARELTVTAESDGLIPASFTFEVKSCERPEYIYSSVNDQVGGILVSQESFAERPDPAHKWDDNDMNSFASLSLEWWSAKYQADFTEGWRIYRIPVKVPSSTSDAKKQVRLTLKRVMCGMAEMYIDGHQIAADGAHYGDELSFELPLCPGEKKEIVMLMAAASPERSGENGNGIGGSVVLSVK